MTTPSAINLLCKRIELAYRKDKKYWNIRLSQINPDVVRKTMKKHRIGLQCKKCLNKGGGRYCSSAHSTYYRSITDQFYGIPYPIELATVGYDNQGFLKLDKVKCAGCKKENSWTSMSKDHIIPITKGGLEFDRNNIQWMHLSCNIRKYNYTESEIIQKQLQRAISAAINLREFMKQARL